MSKLTRIVALTVLALWGMAAMHCKLEAVPGMEFLKTCCFVDSSTPSPKDCESDGCGAVEDGNYRAEEQSASAPQPVFFVALLARTIEALLPEVQVYTCGVCLPPPDLPKGWQFSYRTALPPRAPSFVA